MERDQQELAELESLNNGKPVKVARDFDIGDSIACLRYYAGWADKLSGQVREQYAMVLVLVRHEPSVDPRIRQQVKVLIYASRTHRSLCSNYTLELVSYRFCRPSQYDTNRDVCSLVPSTCSLGKSAP